MQRVSQIVSLIVLACVTQAFAQRGLKNIPDPNPQSQLASFEVAEGFEINLFAADPMLAKPINMNWDAQGRLWVVGSEIYPQIKPGQDSNDKVYVLEDTDGDGRADKSTVFAEGLMVPTAVVPGDGGVYIGNSTELLHLKDTDNDGKADHKRVVLSGFGTEDTHHIVHTLRWGYEGLLYFNQSIYIHSHIETPWGIRRLLAGGVWQFRPENMKLEVHTRGMVNSWGHHYNTWGQHFQTDGAFGEGINYAFPGAIYVAARGQKRRLRGLNPGQPKHCGLEVLSGRHLPEDWRGTMIANDFRGNRVNRFAVSEDRSGYISRQVADVIRTKHVAFRPIDIKMGPDGAIYIADFYNPIIQHGEVDFRDDRRDHVHGRIWRITAKGRPLVKWPKIVGAPIEDLLEILKLPEDLARTHAKLELKARGADAVLPKLDKWVKALDDSQASERLRLEALWIHVALDVANPDLLNRLLGSELHQVRAAAVRVLSHWSDRLDSTMSLLTHVAVDEHPQVRLEAVNALRQVGTGQAVEAAMTAYDLAMDDNLDFALWLTVRELKDKWLPKLVAGRPVFGSKVNRLAFALKAVEDRSGAGSLARLLKDGKVADADLEGTVNLVAGLGGPNELRTLYELARDDSKLSIELRASILRQLKSAAVSRKAKPAGNLNTIQSLLSHSNDVVRSAAAPLAGAWKIQPARAALTRLASDAQTSSSLRLAAIEGLALFGGQPSVQQLVAIASGKSSSEVRSAAVVGLLQIDPNTATTRAVQVLKALADGEASDVIFNAFLGRKDGPNRLAKAIGGQTLPKPVALHGIRKASSAGRNLDGLVKALSTAGGIGQMTLTLSSADMEKMIAEVQSEGDAARGEKIYRRANLLCTQCHAIAGSGGKVGPDLVSIGASAPVDYIIESLLTPNKKIKEGYHLTLVTTKDGKVYSGTLQGQTDRELIIRDAADNQVTIPAANVQSKTISPTSLMPPGLTLTLRRDEFVDLVRFMAELGKEGDYKVGSARMVRTWRVLQGGREVERKIRASSTGLAATNDPLLVWTPAYSNVSGKLALDAMPKLYRFARQAYSYAKFELDVTTGGPIGFKFADPSGIQCWIDGELTGVGSTTQVDLKAGRHVVTIAVDVQSHKTPLSVELFDVPNSAGRAKLVGGK